MLQLAGEFTQLDGLAPSVQRHHFRISTNPSLPKPVAREAAFLCRGEAVPRGFALYLAYEDGQKALEGAPAGTAKGILPASAVYLS